MAKKKKKRKLKIKNIIRAFIILLVLICGSYYLLTMKIKNIYISGNELLTDAEVIEYAKLSNYPSFLLTTNHKIKKSLLKNSYVNNVKITKKLGNKIEIKIEENIPLAIKQDTNQVILSNGLILDNTYNITDAPILTNNIDEKVYNKYIKKFKKLDREVLRQISEITYKPVNVDDERFELYMDDGNLVYITLTKINKLNKYNSIKAAMEDKKGIIYLDSGDYIELK